MYSFYEKAYCEENDAEEYGMNYTGYEEMWAGDSFWFESVTAE
jgi:hypothetical protein